MIVERTQIELETAIKHLFIDTSQFTWVLQEPGRPKLVLIGSNVLIELSGNIAMVRVINEQEKLQFKQLVQQEILS